MKLSQLEKATIIYYDIQNLDAEILELDKIAAVVANGAQIVLRMDVDSLNKKKEEDKVKFDQDGSLVLPGIPQRFGTIHGLMYSYDPFRQPQPDKPDHTLTSPLSENYALRILGILLCEKHHRREVLLGRLAKLGVQ